MDEGVCVMDAADFAENIPGRDSAYQYIPDYGKFESAMKAFPSTAVYEEKDWTKGQAPSLVYHVWAEEAGNYRLDIHTSPANALIYGGPLRMGAAVNEEPAKLVNLVTDTFRGGDTECEEWCTSVLDQEHVASEHHYPVSGRCRCGTGASGDLPGRQQTSEILFGTKEEFSKIKMPGSLRKR